MSNIVLFFKWFGSYTKSQVRRNSDTLSGLFIAATVVWIICTMLWIIGGFHDPSNESKLWEFAGIHAWRGLLVYPLFVEIAIFVLIVAYGILRNFVSFLKSAHSDWRDYKARNDPRNR